MALFTNVPLSQMALSPPPDAPDDRRQACSRKIAATGAAEVGTQACQALLPRGPVRGERGVECCQVAPAPRLVETAPPPRALPVEKVDRLAQASDENVLGVEIGVIETGVMNPGQRFPQHASETT